jgi:hypothetical protein
MSIYQLQWDNEKLWIQWQYMSLKFSLHYTFKGKVTQHFEELN